MIKVGVLGAGTMGAGIAQVAVQSGHNVVLVDLNQEILNKAKEGHEKVFARLVEKGKFTADQVEEMLTKISYSQAMADFKGSGIVIEAIIENLGVKKKVFEELESIVGDTCILASNTSSLSIASIGAALANPSRMIGVHFFNPAPLMPLVEIIPAVQTSTEILDLTKTLVDSWGKITVVCKDTPGFIVNRVARPFYGEALRIYEEGIADFATIDWALTTLGGFRMGPFTLMDYIGNDINYTVTETVFTAFYFDPRYKPSFTQRRHFEAGYLGRKSSRGFYDYAENAVQPIAQENRILGQQIVDRVLAMLMNEAIDALFMQIGSKEAIDLAMKNGVNYPKGLLEWAEEKTLVWVLEQLDALYLEFGEDRYRASALLRRMVREGKTYF